MFFNLLYIDPAATTAILSSVTAFAVALGATFIVLWRKLKKGVQKTLHIDENANKDAEEELVVYDGAEEAVAKDASRAADNTEKQDAQQLS